MRNVRPARKAPHLPRMGEPDPGVKTGRRGRAARGSFRTVLDLRLIRDAEDHRRFDIAGIGTIRLLRGFNNGWELEAPGHGQWATKLPIFAKLTRATDALGTVTATFSKRDQTIITGGRTLRLDGGLRAEGDRRRQPLVLFEGDRELVRYECAAWSGATKHEIEVTVVEKQMARNEPLLVLFGAFAAAIIATKLSGLDAGGVGAAGGGAAG